MTLVLLWSYEVCLVGVRRERTSSAMDRRAQGRPLPIHLQPRRCHHHCLRSRVGDQENATNFLPRLRSISSVGS